GDRGLGGRGTAAVLVWNAETWADFFTITTTAGAPTCAAFAFDENSLLIGTTTGRVEQWSCQAQDRVRTYKLYGSFFLGRPRGVREVIAPTYGGSIVAVPNPNEGRIVRWQLRP